MATNLRSSSAAASPRREYLVEERWGRWWCPRACLHRLGSPVVYIITLPLSGDISNSGSAEAPRVDILALPSAVLDVAIFTSHIMSSSITTPPCVGLAFATSGESSAWRTLVKNKETSHVNILLTKCKVLDTKPASYRTYLCPLRILLVSWRDPMMTSDKHDTGNECSTNDNGHNRHKSLPGWHTTHIHISSHPVGYCSHNTHTYVRFFIHLSQN